MPHSELRRSMTDQKPLDQELQTYMAAREHLEREHMGKFVLIKGSDVVGAYDSFETAADEGLRRFGRSEFLIRKVGEEETHLSAAILYGLTGADFKDVVPTR